MTVGTVGNHAIPVSRVAEIRAVLAQKVGVTEMVVDARSIRPPGRDTPIGTNDDSGSAGVNLHQLNDAPNFELLHQTRAAILDGANAQSQRRGD